LTVEIREARTAGEIAAAGRVTVAANAEFAPAYRADAPMWADYIRSQADAAGRAANGVLLVAVDAGEVVGTVTFFLDRTPHSYPWRPGDPILRFLAVDPAARGRGVGRALLDECLIRARAAGCRRLALHTTAEQRVAREMYERTGFRREPEGDVTMGEVTLLAYARELF
jgi:GNAT superfamily N-acetyltransferase